MAGRQSMNSGGQSPIFVVRGFPGMQNNPAREAIDDEDFYWLENLMPLAPANMLPVGAAQVIGTGISTEGTTPSYTCEFCLVNPLAPLTVTNYTFVAFAGSGNAYIVNSTTGVAMKIISNQLSPAGGTFATQYGNLGLLIVDPNGYWDYNITTTGTLTSWNNTVSGFTQVYATTFPGATALTWYVPATGTGAVFGATFQVQTVSVNNAGTGYVVGDTLSLTDGNPTTPAVITVASTGSGGTITGITLSTPGVYPSSNSNAGSAGVGPNGSTITGGTGTGATFTVKMQVLGLTVVKNGNGYVSGGSPPLGQVGLKTTSGNVEVAGFALIASGVIGGTSIATYGGRVWIGYLRTVYVTDINSYSSFGGAGFSFTVNDAYVSNQITALFSANNYLYLFSDSSIDAISNLVVTDGVSSFSRINLTTSVGTSNPQSIFGYYRALAFFHSSGIYLLAGATPEKISDKVSGVIRLWTRIGGVAGAQILLNGELCLAMQLQINDKITGAGSRFVILMYFKARWWVASISAVCASATLVSTPGAIQNGLLFSQVANQPPQMQGLFTGATLASWLLQTKLWDANSPLREKQVLSVAVAAVLGGAAATGATYTVDTEHGSSPPIALPAPGTANATDYQLLVDAANAVQSEYDMQGSQYMGFTLASSSTNVQQLRLLALRGQAERDMMQ